MRGVIENILIEIRDYLQWPEERQYTESPDLLFRSILESQVIIEADKSEKRVPSYLLVGSEATSLELFKLANALKEWHEKVRDVTEEWRFRNYPGEPKHYLDPHGYTSRTVQRHNTLKSRLESVCLMLEKCLCVEPEPAKGVSVRDVGTALEFVDTDLSRFVKRFSDSKKITARVVGKCPKNKTANLYVLSEILSDFNDYSPTSRSELQRIRKHLESVERQPTK
jgi:hypothetical protein